MNASSSMDRDAPYVINGYLNYEIDLQIGEYYKDTAGYTDQVFGFISGP